MRSPATYLIGIAWCALTPQDALASTTSPFARDFSLANWLVHQVEHEISYLESCRERISEAQRLTELRLQELEAVNARTANLLTVLQTSLLAAFFGVFSIANTLGEKFSVPTPVRAATMAFVASIALLLPPLAFRWANKYGWPELTAIGVVGATAGWLCAVLASYQVSVWIIAAAASLGAALLVGAASVVNGRHPARPPSARS
jgi:hypothetical protein